MLERARKYGRADCLHDKGRPEFIRGLSGREIMSVRYDQSVHIELLPHVGKTNSESAPVPSTLEGLSKAAGSLVFRSLGRRGCLDRLCSVQAATRALAVGAARSQMLPLAEGAMAAIASPMQNAFGMEARKFV